MSAKRVMTDSDIEDIQRRIDEGIRLAQHRLVQQAEHDDLSLVVMRDGVLMELKAKDL